MTIKLSFTALDSYTAGNNHKHMFFLSQLRGSSPDNISCFKSQKEANVKFPIIYFTIFLRQYKIAFEIHKDKQNTPFIMETDEALKQSNSGKVTEQGMGV